MKKNLVKILATSAALMLTLTACGGGTRPSASNQSNSGTASESGSSSQEQGVVETTFAELTTLADGKWELEGREVLIKGACIYGVYDNGRKLTVSEPYSETGHTGGGAEVELVEAYNFVGKDATPSGINGMGAACDVQGIVADVNGHVVIRNATITNVNERLWDAQGNRITGSGAGLSYSYFKDLSKQRDAYSEMGRSDSGLCYELQVSMVTVPEAITATAETNFYVNFPGENPFVDDELNYDLINVTVPAGINADEAEFLNDFFTELEVGDQVTITASLLYNDQGTGLELMISGGWTHFADCYVEAATPVEFISTYAEIFNQFDEKYLTGMLPLGENANVYRYDLTDLYQTPIANITNTSWVSEDLAEDGGLIAFAAYAKSDAVEALAESYGAKLATFGFEDVTGTKKDAKYFRATVEGTVVADAMYAVSSNEAETEFCVYFAFVAPRVVTSAEVSTFEAAVAAIEEEVGGEFESALPGLPATPAASEFKASWLTKDMLDGAETYTIAPKFDEGAFADDDAYEAYAEAYEALLVAAGFVKGYDIPSKQVKEALFNQATGELVFFDFELDEDEENYVGLKLYVVIVGANCTAVYDCTADHAWTYQEAAAYANDAYASYMGGAMSMTDYAAQGYTQMGGRDGLYYASYMNQIAGALLEILAPSCATYEGAYQTTAEENTQNPGHALLDLYWSLSDGSTETCVVLNLEFDAFDYSGVQAMYIYIWGYIAPLSA